MSHRYWGATACAVGFAISWLMPAYMTLEGGAVWRSEVERGWNNRDADGNPLHDDLGNRIKPNPVRHGGVARRKLYQPVVLWSPRPARASQSARRASARQCAGQNRQGVVNARVTRERPSQPSRPRVMR